MIGRQVVATALLLWLSCCVSALWRYYMSSPDYSIFSTRSSINLEYEGSSFVSWEIPQSCKILNATSPKTTLHCKSAGIHNIRPKTGTQIREEQRHLTVDNSYVCFLWYFTVVDVYHNLSQIVTIWVIDPESASVEELTRTAKKPSLSSMVLTKQMNTLGQRPSIFTTEKRLVYHPGPLTSEGTWVIHMPMSTDDLAKVLRGNRVAFQDCLVSNLYFLLAFPMPIMSDPAEYLPLALPAGSPLLISWHTCISTFALLATDQETFQTNDSFRTWTTIRAPPGILTDDERHDLRDVILYENGILILAGTTVYLKTDNEFTRLNESSGIASTGILGFSKRRWCQIRYLYKFSEGKTIVIAWSKTTFYCGYSTFRFEALITTSELKKILKLPLTDTLEILTIEYSWHPQEAALLLSHCSVCADTRNIRLVIYNGIHDLYTLQDFELQVPVGSQLDFRFLSSAMPDIVMWDEHHIYYSYNNFTEAGTIETISGETNLSLISQGSKVHNVLTDTIGNILVKMENNVMFYIKTGITMAVKLHTWTNTTAKTGLLFDRSHQTCILYYNEKLDEEYQLQLHPYPLALELQSINEDLEDWCPYLAFQHNVHSQFYHLDKGESLTIWTQIVYPENRGLYIVLEHYGSEILTWTQNVEYEIASGFCTKTVTTRFFQTTNYELVDDYYYLQKKNTGLTLFQFRPSAISRTCPTAKPVFEIDTGCDSSKYIIVRGFNRSGCQRRDFSYVIDKELLRESVSENLKVRYDVAKYGCPKTLESEEMFHPIVEMHDENGFLKIVEANFILWEIHGRNDYTYNSTMEENGCINEAQTWDSMIEENPGVPLDDVWGPQNYRPCFSYAIGKPGDLSQPYEIVNYSNKNHLKWSISYPGMYVFRLKILDPNYSFCNLTTTFAIESLGIIPRSSVYLVAALIFVLMLTFISILVLSYFWYSKIYRQFIYEPLHKPPGKQKKH
ncbi:cation channel sperm-associated auxiliary subunit epsilon-like isoform X2 [Apodemus sylvaticus]|uniref:cation channel sperm-associated auxiliary subunit epsilon-like isoform X2 n=1 Tax=Apodemus sylvaticus TaxID=10129 RepID=UPI002242B231|nr:cation channel sperm-associated auxiliary subunit epsilon-like isoform X2 [Apodemus sylvaticus]